VGWGQSTSFPYEEGSFFGNLFAAQPTSYYCNGKDFDQGVVPGRLGVTQTNAPYTDPFGATASCKDYCTPQDIPNQNDGYKACYGFNHVVTVWRNFDPNTNYKICNRSTGTCLDGSNTAANAAVVAKTFSGASAQKWKIRQINPKQYQVLNVATGKALTVSGKLSADKTPIVQSAYTGGTEQLFSFTSMANSTGFHAISPVFNIKSVIALGAVNAVQELTWTSATQQQWSLQLAD
jgi:hypothetical protein